jgi:hypothetical protein
MPLNSIVVICLRIFALNWLIIGLIQLVSIFPGARHFGGSPIDYSLLSVALVPLVGSLLTWMWSRTIARMVTPRPDSEVHLGGLTLQDLYSFAFTFLGLYFVLSAIPSLINWLHFTLMQARNEPGSAEDRRYFYDLSHHILTLVAGGACLILAPRFAKKLARAHGKEGPAVQPQNAPTEPGQPG